MSVETARRDPNYRTTIQGVDMTTGLQSTNIYVDPTTHRLLVNSSGTSTAGAISTSSYPMYDRRDLGGFSLSTDSAGALQAFAMVTTDEGTGRANFTGSSLSTSPGSATFTNGSTTVTGSGFTSIDAYYLDYIKLGADAEAAWAQISYINSDTSITLVAAYTGTGGTGTYNLAPAATVTGTGATISVASGQATVALGTNTSAASVLYRALGFPPIRNYLFSTQASISQRVANQDIYIGLESATSSARYFSRFHFNGTNNTQVITETGYNPTGVPSASETETNTITLPSSAVSSTVLTYKIISELEKVFFYINEVLVATHTARLPHVAAQTMNAQIRGVNSGAVTNTNVVTNFIYIRPYEKLETRPTDTARVQIGDGTTSANVTTGNALKTDTTSIAGTATAVNNGASSAGTSRVTIASDSTGNIATIGTSVTPGTAAANLGKAEDAAHVSGDTGVFALGVRNNTASALAGTDGDYIPITTGTNGELWMGLATKLDSQDKITIAGGVMPTDTALNTYSVIISSNTTTTPTSSTAYISSIVVVTTAGGTTSTITVQDKQGTPLKLVNLQTTTAAVAGDTIYNFQTPIKMVSGIDIVTAGAVAATVHVFINYYQ